MDIARPAVTLRGGVASCGRGRYREIRDTALTLVEAAGDGRDNARAAGDADLADIRGAVCGVSRRPPGDAQDRRQSSAGYCCVFVVVVWVVFAPVHGSVWVIVWVCVLPAMPAL